MRKFFILICFILASLTACSPREQDFKSNVPSMSLTDARRQGGLPAVINLDVPFFPQAPDGDWSQPWQDACEEASTTLAYHFVTGEPIDKKAFRSDILGLVDWENTHFGDYKQTTIDQTARMLKGYFAYSNFSIIENPSIKELKHYLASGSVVVAPFAGRELGNPFYRGQGPLYHMMVLKGYDEKNFIVNDVGTRRGHDFVYPYETILRAMHEWHDGDIDLGAKKVLVLSPSSLPASTTSPRP